jgi:hypothetical protein
MTSLPLELKKYKPYIQGPFSLFTLFFFVIANFMEDNLVFHTN